LPLSTGPNPSRKGSRSKTKPSLKIEKKKERGVDSKEAN